MTKATSYYRDPTWLGRQGTWTTDADGRFEVRGVGRDRIIWLGLDGPGLAHLEAYAMARPCANANAQATAAAVGKVVRNDVDMRP